MIYFDNAATTKPYPEVIDVYNKVSSSYWYNSSTMSKAGIIASSLVEKASSTISNILKLNNKTIYYTSSATEANNLAIMGVCNNYKGKRIITSVNEHSSVFNVFKSLEKQGFEVIYLPCKNGTIDALDLKKNLTKDTILVSTMWVNNIIGSINPINEIIDVVKKESHAKLHIDAVQGIGKIPMDFDINKVDLLSIAGHKIHGLKGIGMLIANKEIVLNPIIYGGHQQNNIRPGTVDVAGVVALSKAFTITFDNLDKNYEKVCKLYDYLMNKLSTISNLIIHKKDAIHSPYVVACSFENIKGETVMHYLEQHDIIVGVGSACNEKTKTFERSIMELTNSETLAINMFRISLTDTNTFEEIDILTEKLKELERM